MENLDFVNSENEKIDVALLLSLLITAVFPSGIPKMPKYKKGNIVVPTPLAIEHGAIDGTHKKEIYRVCEVVRYEPSLRQWQYILCKGEAEGYPSYIVKESDIELFAYENKAGG